MTNLIDSLVTSIKESHSQTEVKTLQVSTLTNLSFNNEIGVACLLRFTKTTDLLNCIKDMRVLWCKLAICVTRFDCNMFEFELVSNLKSVFEAEHFTGLIRSNNQLLLRHILELLNVGLKRDEHSRHIMQEFDFHECINEVLTVCRYTSNFYRFQFKCVFPFRAVNRQFRGWFRKYSSPEFILRNC